MPIEPSLFLRELELIQLSPVIADMDLDSDSLSQVEEAFISASFLLLHVPVPCISI